jgi:hypothetical protein
LLFVHGYVGRYTSSTEVLLCFMQYHTWVSLLLASLFCPTISPSTNTKLSWWSQLHSKL